MFTLGSKQKKTFPKNFFAFKNDQQHDKKIGFARSKIVHKELDI